MMSILGFVLVYFAIRSYVVHSKNFLRRNERWTKL